MDTKQIETENHVAADTIETIQDDTLVTATGGFHCYPVAYGAPVAYAAPAYYARPVAYAAPAYAPAYYAPVAYAAPYGRWWR
ncbi:MAG TPA: hypothetical protein VGC42_19990 [Kofleriaceae bacterium]